LAMRTHLLLRRVAALAVPLRGRYNLQSGAHRGVATHAFQDRPRGRSCSSRLFSGATDAELSDSLSKASFVMDATGLWAGWEASFSALSGEPQPIDEYYVSDDLVEWGQVPRGWQVLSLEGATDEAPGSAWSRQVFRVLPESGCAADNVAVAATSSAVDLSRAIPGSWRPPPEDLRPVVLQTLDTGRWPSGEVGPSLAHAPPFIECRTVVSCPTQGGPGDLPPIFMDRPDGPARHRALVEFKFDAAVANIASSTIAVSIMTKVDEGSASEKNSPAAVVAEAVLGAAGASAQRGGGGGRRLGVDASTLARVAGGKNFAERRWEGALAPQASFHAQGVTRLVLPGGIVLEYGLCDEAEAAGALAHRRRDPVAHSFLEVSLVDADPDSTIPATSENHDAPVQKQIGIRREFSRDGLSIYEGALTATLKEPESTAREEEGN